MGALRYGILKGRVTGHLRDADDDHYQILVEANGAMFRVAVNVHSSVSPPDLKFQTLTQLPQALRDALVASPMGFTALASKPGGLAQDFVRGGLIDPGAFKVVPGNVPGVQNDLKDFLEGSVVDALDEAGSLIYALGARWGPEKKPDQYFKFVPGNGVHDIHMNQGNDPGHASDDGVFQDGCLFFQFPGDDSWTGYFMAFQSQSFDTDPVTGHAPGAGGAPGPSPRKPKPRPSKKPKKQSPPRKRKRESKPGRRKHR